MDIVAASAVKKFKVRLVFNDGTSGEVDLSDLAGKGVFKVWMKPGFFKQMYVTSSGAIAWPGDIDLCPDSLYLRLTHKKPKEVFSSLNCLYA
ncbi:MAG: DUF2442 domain-containing protein [Chthoniobacterales bacterium]